MATHLGDQCVKTRGYSSSLQLLDLGELGGNSAVQKLGRHTMPKTTRSKKDDGALEATESKKREMRSKLAFKLWVLLVRVVRFIFFDDLD